MANGDWFGLVAIIISAITLIGGFMARPHFASYARVEKLADENKELRNENKELVRQCNALRMEVEFWRDKFRTSQGGFPTQGNTSE